ncbi:hypothetical protein [Streptomyces sp. KMM 9044]|uniref:hypothetical protein n=1 Tax=Streptomyces sp. KMM 9044 TaxID=2744474 RepID=UPI00215187E6|nr:hypothetical protein [Streptomyces sp. KMM 9044]WAX76599.1 hypothetical protein HUV60_001765 [Streptomyces sp. KMM 9044]
MHAIRVTFAALLGVGAPALASAPGAVAVGGDVAPFCFGVRPALVKPGGQVTLWVDRADGECEGQVAVSSPTLDTVAIPEERSKATTEVYRDAGPGAVHRVAFAREGVTGTTSLTVAGGHPVPLSPLPVEPGGATGHPGGCARRGGRQSGRPRCRRDRARRRACHGPGGRRLPLHPP